MLRSKIARRNIASILLIVITSLTVISVYLIHYFRTSTLESAQDSLMLNARIIEKSLQSNLAVGAHDLPELAAAISSDTSLRITILRPDGTVLADTSESAGELDNHLARSEVQAAIHGEQGYGTAVRYSQTLHENLMYVAIPVYRDGALTGIIRTSTSLASADAAYAETVHVILVAILVSFAAAMAIAVHLTRHQTQPIEQMSRAALAIAGGDLNRRIPLNTNDEFDILAHTINKLTYNLGSKIRESEAKTHKLTLILEHMDNAVMLIDARGKIAETNRQARQIFGLSPDDIHHHSIHLIGLAELSQTAQEILHTGASRTITLKANERTFKVYLSSFRDADDDAVIAVFYDISLLQELVERQRDFTGNAAHELATPLTAIAGFAELLRTDDFTDPEASHHYADVIASESARMTRLIHDLLMLARLDDASYRAQLPRVPVDCAAALRAAASGLEPRLRDKEQELRLVIPHVPGTPDSELGTLLTDGGADSSSTPSPLAILAAPDLIEQILRNLIENAVKYTPEGGTIDLYCSATDTAVEIRIRDSGIGIAPEHLPRIFDRFYRVDKARARATGGNGIGLSLVKFIVELFGGTIEVASRLGEGTTFTLTFPRLDQK